MHAGEGEEDHCFVTVILSQRASRQGHRLVPGRRLYVHRGHKRLPGPVHRSSAARSARSEYDSGTGGAATVQRSGRRV